MKKSTVIIGCCVGAFCLLHNLAVRYLKSKHIERYNEQLLREMEIRSQNTDDPKISGDLLYVK